MFGACYSSLAYHLTEGYYIFTFMNVEGSMADSYEDSAQLFKALAHPIRLQILMMLRQGEECVCHIEAALSKRQAYVSQQLMVLRDAGVVEARKDGLQVFYRLANPAVEPVLASLFGPLDGTPRAIVEGCSCPLCQQAEPCCDEEKIR
jgi:ArsR family transcriptional regulator